MEEEYNVEQDQIQEQEESTFILLIYLIIAIAFVCGLSYFLYYLLLFFTIN